MTSTDELSPSRPSEDEDERLFEEVPVVILFEEDADTANEKETDAGESPQGTETLGRESVVATTSYLELHEVDLYEELGEEDLYDAELRRFLDFVEGEIDGELADELSLGDGAELTAVGWISRAVAGSTLALLGVLAVIGWPYYVLAHGHRPFHHLHSLLRPSGLIGLPLGILGTLLMVASLGYVVRKHLRYTERLGSVRSWLDFHIIAGLVGPVLVAFHAAFVPHSALGILSFGAMVIVVLSGVVGRYVFAFVPKYLEGRELELEVIQTRLSIYRRKLVDLGVSPEDLGSGAAATSERIGLFRAVASFFVPDTEGRKEYERLREAVRARKDVETDRALLLMRRLWRERQWMVKCQELRRVMGSWRFAHRWLAIVLFVGIAYHIAVTVGFGDLWSGLR